MFESKIQRILYALIMAFLCLGLFLYFFISLFMNLIDLGFNPSVIPIWIKSWAVKFFIVFPLILILTPIDKNIVLSN